MEHKKNIIFIIAIAVFIVFSTNIYNSVESCKYRRLCDEYRAELIATEEANRELGKTIGRIAEITGRIAETADANITDARGIIETVEMLRTQIQELEDCCRSFDQSEYYNYWDDEFGISQ